MRPDAILILEILGIVVIVLVLASPRILRWWYGRKLRQLREAFERHAKATEEAQAKIALLSVALDEMRGLYVGRLYRVTYRQRETYSGQIMVRVMTARYAGREPMASDSLVLRPMWTLDPDSQFGVLPGPIEETLDWEPIAEFHAGGSES